MVLGEGVAVFRICNTNQCLETETAHGKLQEVFINCDL